MKSDIIMIDNQGKGFSDAVKGFVLYQAKIVRPKELVVLNCKAGA